MIFVFATIIILAILVIWKHSRIQTNTRDLIVLTKHEQRIGDYIQAKRELLSELDHEPTITEIYLRTWRNET